MYKVYLIAQGVFASMPGEIPAPEHTFSWEINEEQFERISRGADLFIAQDSDLVISYVLEDNAPFAENVI